MAPQLSLTFTENGVTGVAELLEKDAPRTCEMLWKCFQQPAREKVIHAMYAGREIMFPIPQPNRVVDPRGLPPENQTITPLPGEIGFVFYPPHRLLGGGSGKPMDEEFWDLTIFYGRNVRVFSTLGWLPVSIFAKIVTGLPEFAEMCEKVRTEGLKEMEIKWLK